MRYTLRFVSFVVATALGLSVAPIQGADGTLLNERATGAVDGADAWSLRRSRAAAIAAMQSRPLSELPNERRAVRVVYDGYGEARLLRASY